MKIAWMLFLNALLVCFACKVETENDGKAVQRALDALIYVGDAPYSSGPQAGEHGSVQLAFPRYLLQGRQYIFHRKRSPVESWTQIEESLRANGAEIIDAPRGNIGLIFAYVGGPFYVIEFRMGQLRCSIRNTMAAELASHGLTPEMQQEDFILHVE
jgi:hypothetical protein